MIEGAEAAAAVVELLGGGLRVTTDQPCHENGVIPVGATIDGVEVLESSTRGSGRLQDAGAGPGTIP